MEEVTRQPSERGRPAPAQRDTLQPPIARQAGGDYGDGCRRRGGEGLGGEGGVGMADGIYYDCIYFIECLYIEYYGLCIVKVHA